MIIPVVEIDVRPGHHTLWINAADGTTTMRIKCTGKVTVDKACANPFAHGDIMVDGDIHICIPA